jgi:hypothetical protein
MSYYEWRAYKNLSATLDQTNLPLPGRTKYEDYSELGRVYHSRARKWRNITGVVAVLGGLGFVMIAALLG